MTSPSESAFTVEIMLFAGLRERLQGDRLELALPGACTVAELEARLRQEHPALATAVFRIALNERYAEPSTPIVPGDLLALIPPVSGG